MLSLSLIDGWSFRQVGDNTWHPAVVPGGVHTDLLNAGLIPDPFVADNEIDVQWVAERDWEYRLEFSLGEDLLAMERIDLLAEGLDTLAELYLNGELLGSSTNMFHSNRWQVSSRLRPDENELLIRFSSPVAYIQDQQTQRDLYGVDQAIPGASHIRKAPCQFGWDWGPQLPPIGIWREICLEGYHTARMSDVHLRQSQHDDHARIHADIQVESWGQSELAVHMRVTSPAGEQWLADAVLDGGQAELSIGIEEPQLWWPNGYGDQPLYKVEVWLQDGGQELDRGDYQLGLRTIELLRQDDQWGQSFTFVVNGVTVFAKGSNWIPADSFPTRISEIHLEGLIRSAVETHQNMLRVWGGGLYESELFYDLCDRYGVLVWQDFIFSCSIYPLDEPDFLASVESEVDENVRRLRHRTCLALWCGNNEMDIGWEEWGWAKLENEDLIVSFLMNSPSLKQYLSLLRAHKLHPQWQQLRQAYQQFFYETLPAWVAKLDPDRPYWPSSPSSNTPFQGANAVESGDTHDWNVWHGNLPFDGYREHPSRFVSEFGFQSLPALETIRTYAEQADWNMTSYIMEHHQRNQAGNRKIMSYLGDHFRQPKDFPALVYLTQILQAEALRIGVEYWRRERVRTSGTLYWQLNDCWPVASWSSLDYYGRWKAAHYAARRFYAPLLLSIEDRDLHMSVHVTSDLTELWEGKLVWMLQTLDGEVLAGGEAPVIAQPLENTPMLELDFSNRISPAERREVVLVCELRQDSALLAARLATFAPDKHLSLRDPELAFQVSCIGEQLQVELKAISLARYVELSIEGADLVFSDNYFDLPAGRKCTIHAPWPEGWTLEQVRLGLKVRSLYDSF